MVLGASAKDYWESELSVLAENTVYNYRNGLRHFLEHLGVDHEGLYEMQKACLEDGDRRSDRRVVLVLRSFLQEMVDEGYAGGTTHNIAAAVKKFMDTNKLHFDIRRRDLPPMNVQGSYPFSHDHIREIYDLCNAPFRLRNRALIMVSKDTGFRCSDLSNFDVEHYLEAHSVCTLEGERFKVFKPYATKKTGELAYPHLGPEAIEALEGYRDGRESGPLFLNRSGKRLSGVSISEIFSRLTAKIDGGDNLSHHSFRKFHRTQLEARMRASWIKKLQGKATDPYTMPERTTETDAPDNLRGESKLTVAYIQNYDVLRIFQNRELKKLRKTVKEQRERVNVIPYLQARIEAQNLELERQREESKRIEATLQEIMRNLKIRKQIREKRREEEKGA